MFDFIVLSHWKWTLANTEMEIKNGQHWVDKTQNEDEQSKTTT